MRRVRGKIKRDINNQRNISHFSGVPFFCSLVASFEAMCIKLPHKQMQQTQKKNPTQKKLKALVQFYKEKRKNHFRQTGKMLKNYSARHLRLRKLRNQWYMENVLPDHILNNISIVSAD